jgi:hypothetical protein
MLRQYLERDHEYNLKRLYITFDSLRHIQKCTSVITIQHSDIRFEVPNKVRLTFEYCFGIKFSCSEIYLSPNGI